MNRTPVEHGWSASIKSLLVLLFLTKSSQRGAGPSPVESCILAWVAGGETLVTVMMEMVVMW